VLDLDERTVVHLRKTDKLDFSSFTTSSFEASLLRKARCILLLIQNFLCELFLKVELFIVSEIASMRKTSMTDGTEDFVLVKWFIPRKKFVRTIPIRSGSRIEKSTGI
jgi:hypothetical protein